LGSAQHSNPPRMACNSLLQENPNARGNGGSRARVSRPRSRGVARRTRRAHHALAPKAPARESLRSSGLSAARRGCKTDPLHARRAAICTNWLAAPSSLYLLCYVQRVISVEGAARIWRVRRHHPCAKRALRPASCRGALPSEDISSGEILIAQPWHRRPVRMAVVEQCHTDSRHCVN